MELELGEHGAMFCRARVEAWHNSPEHSRDCTNSPWMLRDRVKLPGASKISTSRTAYRIRRYDTAIYK